MNKKKQQILEAAKTLFIKKGFANTSITDIIELAKVSKGTFYNHFPSKNACLIAIIHDIHENTISERKKILAIESPYQLQTLAKELISFYNIIMMSNLFEIMIQNISFKDDAEIMIEVRNQSTSELIWLAQRLTDIFGQRISNIALDCASLVMGTIQHTSYLSMMHNIPNTIEVIVEETLKKIEPIVYSSDLNRRVLLHVDSFTQGKNNSSCKSALIQNIITSLEKFYEEELDKFTSENIEYTLFLIDLLNESPNKKFVIQTLVDSFEKSFKGGKFSCIVEKLSKNILELI